MFEELIRLSHHFLEIKNQRYRRYFILREQLRHSMSLLMGQRGIGKTTTLVQHLSDLVNGDLFDERILYVQADHFLIGNVSLYEIAEKFHLMNGKYLAIDEIHKYPDWSRELKSISDTFPELKVLASGSSALEIHRGSHDLSRRAIVYQMQGLSLREYLELSLDVKLEAYSLDEILNRHIAIAHEITEKLLSIDEKILPLFKRYLQSGYYPYFKELPEDGLFEITLEQNIHTTIESDLAAIYPNIAGSTVVKLKRLLSFIATAVPFIPNWKKLQELMQVGDVRTLKTYFHHLEDAGLIRTIRKTSNKMAQVDVKGKVYLDNPNQLQVIGGENKNVGTVRETFFINMLKESHSVSLPEEGDFLVNELLLFEVGGKKKSFHQVRNEQNAYVACDGIEKGIKNKIPLWLFGFLY